MTSITFKAEFCLNVRAGVVYAISPPKLLGVET